ncbi:MAG: P-loop NTPase [bacterium]
MIGQAERLHELNALKRLSQPLVASCPIIAFTSGKGGTGKSFVSLNLAAALARVNKKVLIVDMDANLSSINVMMNISAKETIYHFFMNKCLLNEIIIKYDTHLHLIPGDSGKIDHPVLTSDKLNYFFEQLKFVSKNYDYIFIDSGAGAGDEVLSILSFVNSPVIVTNPEPTAIMDAYVIIKLLLNDFNRNQIHVIINRAKSMMEGKSAFENLNKAVRFFLSYELNLLGVIETGDEASMSITEQKIMLKAYPDSRLARQIIALSKNFDKMHQLANNSQ